MCTFSAFVGPDNKLSKIYITYIIITGGIFCDLTKAFDCINHSTLLSKLRYCGITGTFYSLIKSYLEDRHQRVKVVNNGYKSCSSLGIVKHDVPQGSILGPFLFLLYINDITKVTVTKDNNKSKLVLFTEIQV